MGKASRNPTKVSYKDRVARKAQEIADEQADDDRFCRNLVLLCVFSIIVCFVGEYLLLVLGTHRAVNLTSRDSVGWDLPTIFLASRHGKQSTGFSRPHRVFEWQISPQTTLPASAKQS